jgi:hypothetical protein
MRGWGTIELGSEALEARVSRNERVSDASEHWNGVSPTRVTAPDQGAEGQGQVPGDAGERSQQSVQGVPATRVGRRS